MLPLRVRSVSSSSVIRNPDKTKNTSRPELPPAKPGMLAWYAARLQVPVRKRYAAAVSHRDKPPTTGLGGDAVTRAEAAALLRWRRLRSSRYMAARLGDGPAVGGEVDSRLGWG